MSESKPPDLHRPSWADRVPRVSPFDLVEKYRRRMVHKETGLPFEPTRPPSPLTFERLAFETRGGMKLALRLFFPVCAVVFAVSFLWDWHSLIRSCSVAGMIGFGTNWVAIKMLFWPRSPRPVFGQGLIPSQRDQLIEKVADEVLRNLINEELILERIEQTRIVQRFTGGWIDRLREVVHTPEFKRDLRNMILTVVSDLASNTEFRQRLADRAERSLEEFAGDRFRGWLFRRLKEVWRTPLIAVLEKEIEALEGTLDEGMVHLDEIADRLPAALEARQDQIDKVVTTMLVGLVREVDIREIVMSQLSTITAVELERGFREFSDDKLAYITLLGGVLGVVGGVVIVWPIPAIVGLLALLGVLAAVDAILHPLMASRYYPRKR